MNSKTRMLNAMKCQAVDHTPLFLRFWSIGGEDKIPFNWQDQIRRAEYLTSRGLDDALLIQPPLGYIEDYNVNLVPGISQSIRIIAGKPGDECQVLEKTYETPAGELKHIVQKTADWIHGNDIYLFSDYNVSRAKEHLIKDSSDLTRLVFLLNDPSSQQLEQFRQNAAIIRQAADQLGVSIDGGWVALGDAAVDLCGMEKVMMAQFDEPELLEGLLDILVEWELKRINLVLDEGVDTIVYMAWYEGSDFWTPANFRSILKPRIAQLIERVHQAGRLFRYIITKGSSPIIDDLCEIGVDCITGIDPVQDNIDMKTIKEKFGHRLCLMGGTNAAVMFSQWTDQQIRQAVAAAMQDLASGSGFILFPVDNFFCDMPWEKLEVYIKSWQDAIAM